MSSPMRCRPCSKQSWGSKEAAQLALDAILAQPADIVGKRPVRVYHERQCGFWHHTSQSLHGTGKDRQPIDTGKPRR